MLQVITAEQSSIKFALHFPIRVLQDPLKQSLLVEQVSPFAALQTPLEQINDLHYELDEQECPFFPTQTLPTQ